MYPDIEDLQSFYHKTVLGRQVQRILRIHLSELWPDVHTDQIVGYGYTTPFLSPFRTQTANVIALMPEQQGVCHWPRNEPTLTALVQEAHWPLQTSSVSRILFAHALENSDQSRALLDEAWRVLKPDGRIVFIVPNRSGVWARRDKTPFGFGRPYSLGQLETTLARHQFECLGHVGALYCMPSHRAFWLRTNALIESVGQSVGPSYFAGVWVLEAVKRTYAAIPPARLQSGLTRVPTTQGSIAHARTQ